ncbi:TetR family transcriptional regulator, partial [Acinetobacter baumannii]
KPDADMVLNLIDGLMSQFLSSNSLDERDMVVEMFLNLT